MRRFAAAAALTLACLAAVIFACQWTDRCLGEWEDLLERTRQAAQRGDLEEARLLTEALNRSLEAVSYTHLVPSPAAPSACPGAWFCACPPEAAEPRPGSARDNASSSSPQCPGAGLSICIGA